MASGLIKYTGNLIGAIWAVLCLDMVAMLMFVFIIPESVSANLLAKRQQQEKRETSNLSWVSLNLLKPGQALWSISMAQPHNICRNIIALLIMNVLFGVIIDLRAEVAVLYPQMKFSWTAVEIGYLSAATACTRLILLTLIIPICIKALHHLYNENSNDIPGISKTDLTIIQSGNMFEIVGYIFAGLARNGVEFSVSEFISTIGVVSKITVQSAILNVVPKNRIGEFIGGQLLLNKIAKVIFNSVGQYIYSFTVSTRPELLFFICAMGYVIANMTSLLVSTSHHFPIA
jgi:hypothetical protein